MSDDREYVPTDATAPEPFTPTEAPIPVDLSTFPDAPTGDSTDDVAEPVGTEPVTEPGTEPETPAVEPDPPLWVDVVDANAPAPEATPEAPTDATPVPSPVETPVTEPVPTPAEPTPAEPVVADKVPYDLDDDGIPVASQPIQEADKLEFLYNLLKEALGEQFKSQAFRFKLRKNHQRK